jgi:hypothetical protein
MNPFKTVILRQGRDGRYFVLHPFYRFGPLAVPLMLIGTGVQAYGQLQAGKEEDSTSRYNQQVKEREAQALEQQKRVESRRQAEEASRRLSTLKLNLGASGQVTSEGTPLQIIREQARQDELENLNIGYEGTTGAENLRAQGREIRRQGKVAKQASRIKAGSTLLTGFGESGLFKSSPKKLSNTANATLLRY